MKINGTECTDGATGRSVLLARYTDRPLLTWVREQTTARLRSLIAEWEGDPDGKPLELEALRAELVRRESAVVVRDQGRAE